MFENIKDPEEQRKALIEAFGEHIGNEIYLFETGQWDGGVILLDEDGNETKPITD